MDQVWTVVTETVCVIENSFPCVPETKGCFSIAGFRFQRSSLWLFVVFALLGCSDRNIEDIEMSAQVDEFRPSLLGKISIASPPSGSRDNPFSLCFQTHEEFIKFGRFGEEFKRCIGKVFSAVKNKAVQWNLNSTDEKHPDNMTENQYFYSQGRTEGFAAFRLNLGDNSRDQAFGEYFFSIRVGYGDSISYRAIGVNFQSYFARNPAARGSRSYFSVSEGGCDDDRANETDTQQVRKFVLEQIAALNKCVTEISSNESCGL